MSSLKQFGLDEVLVEQAAVGKPILGICIGTQVIMHHSAENDTRCLGLVRGRVVAFPAGLTGENGRPLKIPHMGWNASISGLITLSCGDSPGGRILLCAQLLSHPRRSGLCAGHHGLRPQLYCGHRQDNLVATQFHLEKSGRPGLRMLTNFCNWKPPFRSRSC